MYVSPTTLAAAPLTLQIIALFRQHGVVHVFVRVCVSLFVCLCFFFVFFLSVKHLLFAQMC